jgi:hypothetical protein
MLVAVEAEHILLALALVVLVVAELEQRITIIMEVLVTQTQVAVVAVVDRLQNLAAQVSSSSAGRKINTKRFSKCQ